MKDAERAEKRPLGPDLLGVTHKRDRAWLNRWMAEPDKVLAEKDPLAMKLLAEYNNLPMPNLGLNGVEIQDVLAYIDEESHRMEHHHHEGEQKHQ
jgi:cbb3-type cytochrome oxidase cytochrome c subunit